jgi:PPOX class probable F420-dependent enzyme
VQTERVIPETHRDLLEAPLTATVTTIGADGFPQSSAIWFLWEDGRLWYSTKHWAAKYRNAAARPATSVLVLDPHDEFRYVEIRGTSSTGPDPGCAGRDRIRAKHGIAPGAPDPAADALVVVTIDPVHVTVHGGAPRRR